MIVFFACVLFSCDIRKNKTRDQDVASEPAIPAFKDSTTVQLIDSLYDFGKVTDGEKVEFSFRFKNTGKNPLIVSNATASCGCTVPEKPEQPIKPGEMGFIKVAFDSKGRPGAAHKEVFVTSNAYPVFPTLAIKGEVAEAKK